MAQPLATPRKRFSVFNFLLHKKAKGDVVVSQSGAGACPKRRHLRSD